MTPAEILAWLRLETEPGEEEAEAADLIESLQAENADLHEQVSALESREVCTVAHDDVETCGYCQRDRIRKIVDESVPVLESLVHAFGDCLVRDRAKAIIARAREEG